VAKPPASARRPRTTFDFRPIPNGSEAPPSREPARKEPAICQKCGKEAWLNLAETPDGPRQLCTPCASGVCQGCEQTALLSLVVTRKGNQQLCPMCAWQLEGR
jgi:hypothetical protein